MKPAKGRVLYFDILNVIACIAVVFIHHNGLVHKYNPNLAGAWSQSLVVEVLAFFAVPIFLMLTGATLMEYRKRYDTRTFFKKRFSRVLIPFVIWSIIVFIYAIWRGRYQLDELTVTSVINSLLTQESMIVYWFFPVILSIYLAMPILSLLTKPAHRKWLWYMVIVGVITYSVIPPIFNSLGLMINSGYLFPLTGSGGYIIYPILGYLLATEKNIKTKWLVIICIAAVLMLVLRYIVTYFLTMQDGTANHLLSQYVYITSIIPAVAVFLIAKRIQWDTFIKGKGVSVLMAVSSCSLGIYLIHMFVIDAEFWLFDFSGNEFIFRVVMPIATYLASLAIVWIVKSGVISRRLFP